MAHVEQVLGGNAYGAATLVTDLVATAGQGVAITGDDEVALAAGDDGGGFFGILMKSAVIDDMVVVLCNGAIGATDNYTDGVAAGDLLAIDATTKLLRTLAGTDDGIGRALSVAGGVLRFSLFC